MDSSRSIWSFGKIIARGIPTIPAPAPKSSTFSPGERISCGIREGMINLFTISSFVRRREIRFIFSFQRSNSSIYLGFLALALVNVSRETLVVDIEGYC